MERESDVVEVDGIEYAVRFNGFHEPISTRAADGTEVSLRPWTCGEHLRLLGRHLRPAGQGVWLDSQGYTRDMLEAQGVPGHLINELAPLALWWAAAGARETKSQADSDGWIALGAIRGRLSPWTSSERLNAMASSLIVEPDGNSSFDVGSYLRAMLEASVVEVDPAGSEIFELDSEAATELVDLVVALNVPEDAFGNQVSQGLHIGSEQIAVNTLRLCRAIGWTPSQVWSTPAPDVDALLSMLDMVEGKIPDAPPQFQGLAAHPDAIVVQVEDE